MFKGQSCTRKCKFQYAAASTPQLESLSSAEVNGNTVLTIAGSKFSTVTDDYIITVGNNTCPVQSATATEVTCLLEPGPAGTFNVGMVIKSMGEASQPSTGMEIYEL